MGSMVSPRRRFGGYLRSARLKVSPAFSKAAGCRGGAPARAPQSAELSCANEAQEGARGNPRPGFPLFAFVRVRLYVWAVALRPTARHPISFALAKRNGVSPKEKRLLAGVFTIPTVFSPLYLPEAVALPVRTARPPPAETTTCVDCQITDHLTFAGGERCI